MYRTAILSHLNSHCAVWLLATYGFAACLCANYGLERFRRSLGRWQTPVYRGTPALGDQRTARLRGD
jgi:hypothetical protein